MVLVLLVLVLCGATVILTRRDVGGIERGARR